MVAVVRRRPRAVQRDRPHRVYRTVGLQNPTALRQNGMYVSRDSLNIPSW